MYTERLAQVRTLCSEKRRVWGIADGGRGGGRVEEVFRLLIKAAHNEFEFEQDRLCV